MGEPDKEPVYPKYPTRIRTFLYGLGSFAHEEETMKLKAMAGVSMKRKMGM